MTPITHCSENISKLQQLAAKIVHWLLYILILIVPLSGYFYSLAAGSAVVYLGIIPLPVLIQPDTQLAHTLKELHEILVYTMVALVVLHLMAALKHHIFDGDNTLAKMLPFLEK